MTAEEETINKIFYLHSILLLESNKDNREVIMSRIEKSLKSYHKESSKELVEALENFVKAVKNEDIIIMDNIDSDGFGSAGNFLYRQAEKALENHLK